MSDRTEWLKKRKSTLGASQWAAVLGLSKWQKPVDVWLDKQNKDVSDDMTEAQSLGHELQPVIGRIAAERIGAEILQEEIHRVSDTENWASATIDYLCKDKDGHLILECKATRDYSWDFIPDYYRVQLAVQCFVHGIDRAVIAVLHASTKLETYGFRLSENSWWPETLDAARAWWNEHVVLGIAPEGHAEPVSIPAVHGKQAELTDEAFEALSEYQRHKADAKKSSEQADYYQKLIQAHLQDAEIGVYQGRPLVTWKESTTERFDTKAMQKDCPDIYSKYTKQSVSRRFLIKEKELDAISI